MDVGGAVGQLRLLLHGQRVVAIVALNASPGQQLLLLGITPRSASHVPQIQPHPLLLPRPLHCPPPRLLRHPRPLLLFGAAVAHAQAQRPLLEGDVGEASSPAIHRGAHLGHAHVHAALQDATAHAQAQGQVLLDGAGLEEVVRVTAVHREAEPAQVDGAVQDGRHPPAVLTGHADDLGAHSAARDGESDAGAKDGGAGGKGGRVGRSVAGGAHRAWDQR